MSEPNPPSQAHRLIVPLAAGLVIVATAFRAWSMRGTWFYYDDFPFIVQAVREPLTVDRMMSQYLGHLMPAGRLFAWVATRQAPLDYRPFAIGILMAFAFAGLGMARLLLNLFGRRWGILPPLVVFLFSPLLVESTLWWSVAFTQIPALVAITWGLDAHIRFVRTGRTRHLIMSVGWVAFGLLFTEVALLAYLFFLVLMPAYFASGSLMDRFRTVWSEQRRAVVAHAGLAALYIGIYLRSTPERFPPGRSHPLLDYLFTMGAKAFSSSVIGGPLSWRRVWTAQIEAAPSDMVVLLSWAVVGGLVYIARRSRARSMRSMVLVLVVLAAKVLLLSSSRGVFGPAFALDVRFAYDLAPAFALSLGLAFMPVRGAVESACRRQPDPLVDNPRVVSAALVVFVLLSSVTAMRYPLRHLGAESPQSYVRTLRSSLEQVHGPVQMAPGAVPLFVFGGAEGHYSSFLPLVSSRFVVPKVALDEVYDTDARGRLVPAQIKPARREDRTHARPAGCPFPGRDGRVSVPLDGPVLGFGWLLSVEYRSDGRTAAVITTGDVRTPVDLPAGSHRVLLPADARYDSVEVRATDPAVSLCIDHVTVGTLSPDR